MARVVETLREPTMDIRQLALTTATTLVLSVGCASQESGSTDLSSDSGHSEDDLKESSSGRVSLKYEGTCEFLRSCSKWSTNMPKDQVSWGCTGVGICDDAARWVAAPSRSYCGKTIKICSKSSQCTTALVKDVSVSKDWEASNGVLDALGLPHGFKGKCGGYGGGTVTLAVTSDDSKEEPREEPSPGDKDDDNNTSSKGNHDGCWSATIEADVEELTCVESRADGVWRQCWKGQWYRGVDGDDGPYGRCSSVHPL